MASDKVPFLQEPRRESPAPLCAFMPPASNEGIPAISSDIKKSLALLFVILATGLAVGRAVCCGVQMSSSHRAPADLENNSSKKSAE
jgi:hypothetical protein